MRWGMPPRTRPPVTNVRNTTSAQWRDGWSCRNPKFRSMTKAGAALFTQERGEKRPRPGNAGHRKRPRSFIPMCRISDALNRYRGRMHAALLEQRRRAELATAVSMILYCGASRHPTGGLAEEVSGDVDYREASSFFCMRFKIGLHKKLDGLFAGIDFDAYRRIAKIHFVSPPILSSDDCVRHFFVTSRAAS